MRCNCSHVFELPQVGTERSNIDQVRAGAVIALERA